MNSTPDPALLGAHDLALAALHEITPAATVGPAAGYTPEADDVLSFRFENRLRGYRGWFWTVTVARVEGEEPTVLEAELLPGEDALLAPEWIPWAVRLADYQAAQNSPVDADESDDDGSDDEEDDLEDDESDDVEDSDDDDLEGVDDLEVSDFDEDGSRLLHSGDVDGVDIDELDDSVSDDELVDDVEDDIDEPDDDDTDEPDDDDTDEDDSDESGSRSS